MAGLSFAENTDLDRHLLKQAHSRKWLFFCETGGMPIEVVSRLRHLQRKKKPPEIPILGVRHSKRYGPRALSEMLPY